MLNGLVSGFKNGPSDFLQSSMHHFDLKLGNVVGGGQNKVV